MEQPAVNQTGENFGPVLRDLAGSFVPPKNADGKKTLISVRSMKKYFPVYGNRNMFVKANDGIDLDIYEGETFGLVGESGCGKSTFGRTLLQLYPQTQGRTVFYGQSVSALRPKYLLDSVKNLRVQKRKLAKLYADAKDTDSGSNERKEAGFMFSDLVRIFGGLLLHDGDSEITDAYMEYYSGKNAGDRDSGRLDALRRCVAGSPGIDAKTFNDLENMRDDGIDLGRLTYDEMRLLRRNMQIIFQDPYSSLNPRMTVGQIIGEGPLAHGFFPGEGEELQAHVMKAMEDCGLAPYMIHRYPHQFSGGQRQRIGIARSLAVKPQFVVCDEAVSALDVSIQSQILNLLSDLREKENLTYLFISHDLSVVKYISDRIGVMYLGNIVELAPSEEIFRRPMHPYTEALLSAIPVTDLDRPKNSIILEGDIPSPIDPPKGCKFHTRCRHVTDVCRELEPPLTEYAAGHFAACHRCRA